MGGMSVSGAGSAGYYQSQMTSSQAAPAQSEQESVAEALQKEQEEQPTLVDMMREAREKAEAAAKKRDEMLKKTANRRYGDAAVMAYSKLARARSAGEVDAASGYARRQIAQLRAAKQNDADNADRIQAAINQLQKAVNRAGRKKRELSQEKASAVRQARLEKEKRTREAKRQRQELRCRQSARVIRESGYIREAATDNRIQDQLSASKLELRSQMQQLTTSTQVSLDAAIQSYTGAAEPALAPEAEISVQA